LANSTPSILELAYAQWLTTEEQARERAVVQARAYHDGDQSVYLTERMKKVLGTDAKFNLNLVRTVVMAVAELLLVKRFECADEQQAEWAQVVWDAARMNEKHGDVHEGVLRDGEFFVIVDWDAANARPRFTPHQRYTDPTVFVAGASSANGDGFGCRAFYPDDDDNQPMLYASKRWTQYLGNGQARQRKTDYYPDRVEKYVAQGGAWIPANEDVDPDTGAIVFPLPWVDAHGEPLGIPVIHFRNPGLRSEAWDALPIQKLINKMLIDLLIAGDITAFRIFVALGFIPTSDGQAPRKNAQGEIENALDLEPGQIIGTPRAATEAAFNAIEPAQLTPFLETIEKAIAWTAMVTGTPVSRFQLTGQVASADSQKEGTTPLLSKCRNRQTRFGNAWIDAMTIARKLANVFGGESFDESQLITLLWEPLEPRDTLAELTEKEKFWTIVANTVAQTAGEISAEIVLRDLGWTDEQIFASGIRERVTQEVIPNVGQ
jgi:hypothetical protein